jgi:hypothetical protein
LAVKRLTPQAVDAYLRRRHSCISAALMDAGVDQKYLAAETLSSGIIGRIARRWAMTPEQFVAAVEQFGKP